MDAIPLSKRRPYVQKLLYKRLKHNFYEENTFPSLLKKFEFTSNLKTRYFSKIHLTKNKKNIQIDEGFVSNYRFLEVL